MCFGCSKELSHGDGFFEYPEHMFWLRIKKFNFHLQSLIWWPAIVSRSIFEQEMKSVEQMLEFLTKRLKDAETAHWRGMFKKNPLW